MCSVAWGSSGWQTSGDVRSVRLHRCDRM